MTHRPPLYESGTRVLQECYENVTRVLREYQFGKLLIMNNIILPPRVDNGFPSHLFGNLLVRVFHRTYLASCW